MASKLGMAGGIPERRVRPIWDAVDSRQFKTAFKLSNALLTKFPHSPYALALKALIVERMGKPDEASVLCLSAKDQLFSADSFQIDDLTLSTLQIVFQRLDRLDLATSCYEHASGKCPNNLELMMGLFNCYVREYSYTKQQQTAIKLYKIVAEERFLLWAVCSIQLQVIYGDVGDKLLPLAEGLIKKHIAAHSLHEPEALLIYISLLEKQSKYGDALEILSGKLGSLILIEGDRLRMQGRLLARSCDYAAAAEVFQKIVESSPDDWECFVHYLDCLLEDNSRWSTEMGTDLVELNTCKMPHEDEVFDSHMANALCFVQRLQTSSASGSMKGPFLAKLEIEKRRLLYGKDHDGSKLTETLLDYFSRFGHLSSFTSDVEMFVQVLTPDDKTTLFLGIMNIYESSSASPINKLNQVISIYKTKVLFGNMYRLPVHELEVTATQMAEKYCESLPFSKDLDLQENMHGEELLSLASDVLVMLYFRTRDLGYLVEAIMVSEFGLTVRRFIWQYRIHLVHLYSYFGALPAAYEWYKTLDVKNILLETTSHHILPELLRSPLWSNLSDLLNEYLTFMDDHLKESADLTFLAYRHRNYTKVIEFVMFKDRLQHSYQFLLARIENSILQLKLKADNLEAVKTEIFRSGIENFEVFEEHCKYLTFNEDMENRPWWSPASDKNFLYDPPSDLSQEKYFSLKEKLNKAKIAPDKREASARKIIERRYLLPQLISMSIKSSSSLRQIVEPNGQAHDSKERNKSDFKCLLEQYTKTLGCSFEEAVKVIVEVSRGDHSFKDLGSDVVDWMQFAIFMNAWKLSLGDIGPLDGEGCGLTSWSLVDNFMEKFTAELLLSAQPLSTCPGGNLAILVQTVSEPFSWHALIIQSCIGSLKPTGKKKKKSGLTDQLQTPLVQAIRCSIKTLSSLLEKLAQWLKDQIETPEGEKLDFILSPLLRNGSSDGPGRVLQILEAFAASAISSEVGDRICDELRSWSSASVATKIMEGQKKVLSELHSICDTKLKLLRSLNQQVV